MPFEITPTPHERCINLQARPTNFISGVADDACFARNGLASGSIADEFARKGVRFQPAKKADRISGWQMANGKWQMADGRWQMADGRWQMADGRWQMMRRLLADAGKPDVPGLYVSRSCEYF